MFERLADLAAEHAQLEHDLADPSIHSDHERARTLGRRYGALSPIVSAYAEWQHTSADEAAARELAHEDASFAAEAVAACGPPGGAAAPAGRSCWYPATRTTTRT